MPPYGRLKHRHSLGPAGLLKKKSEYLFAFGFRLPSAPKRTTFYQFLRGPRAMQAQGQAIPLVLPREEGGSPTRLIQLKLRPVVEHHLPLKPAYFPSRSPQWELERRSRVVSHVVTAIH